MSDNTAEGKMILLLEDNDNVVYTIINIAQRLGFEYLQTQDFLQADYWVERTPKLNSFAYLIVDLSIPCKDEDCFSEDERKELDGLSDSVKLSGWIWLKRLCENYPEAKKKIIVLSAFLSDLPDSERSIFENDIIFFDKARPETVSELDKLLSQN